MVPSADTKRLQAPRLLPISSLLSACVLPASISLAPHPRPNVPNPKLPVKELRRKPEAAKLYNGTLHTAGTP